MTQKEMQMSLPSSWRERNKWLNEQAKGKINIICKWLKYIGNLYRRKEEVEAN